MKIQILSDLHIGFSKPERDSLKTDADVVIIAGDIIEGVRGVEWASENFPDQTVIYVAGNHEFYGQNINFHKKLRLKSASTHNVIFLEKDFVDIKGVRFYGSTLWTDYNLFETQFKSMTFARSCMTDFIKIRNGKTFQKIKPLDILKEHEDSISWLKQQMYDGPKVVITHHAPHTQSLDMYWETDPLAPSYASNQEAIIKNMSPALWVHGHIHDHNDYRVGNTRIVSNPRGYPDEASNFISDFCVEI